MLVDINIFVILFYLIALSLIFGGVKYFLSKVFDFSSPRLIWLKYSLFYMVAIGIYFVVSYNFPYDNFPKILTLLGIVLADILIFYFKYYNLEEEGKYILFIILSTVISGMVIYIFTIFLGTFLVLTTT